MSAQPPIPLPAATMLLLRERRTLEVFMVVRHEKLEFGSGALVFPGGKVDPPDADAGLRDMCAAAALTDSDLTHRVAAIREAFEEAGILLARDAAGDMVGGPRLEELAKYRHWLERGEIHIGDFLRGESLTLACDALEHFAHWITPEDRKKRFDTHFYIAPAPNDHAGAHDGRESVDSIWADPAVVLQQAKDGMWKLMPPTRAALKRLALSDTVDDALNEARATPVVTVHARPAPE